MNYQCSNEFILALRDIAQICEENNTDNLRLSFDVSDNMELCVYISFEVKESNDNKKPTNADRIRSMSDEELAEFLHDYSNHTCSYCKGCGVSCKAHNLAWLQSEVEE